MEAEARNRDFVTAFSVVSSHKFVSSLEGGKASQRILAKSIVQRLYNKTLIFLTLALSDIQNTLWLTQRMRKEGSICSILYLGISSANLKSNLDFPGVSDLNPTLLYLWTKALACFLQGFVSKASGLIKPLLDWFGWRELVHLKVHGKINFL